MRSCSAACMSNGTAGSLLERRWLPTSTSCRSTRVYHRRLLTRQAHLAQHGRPDKLQEQQSQQQDQPEHFQQQQQQQQFWGKADRQQQVAPIGKHRYLLRTSTSLAQALHVRPAEARDMLTAYPILGNYNHQSLAMKLGELSSLLRVPPQVLGPALVAAPKVLGYSLSELEGRLDALTVIQPDWQLLSKLILEDPSLLTWSRQHLHDRLRKMAQSLGTSIDRVLILLRKHPRLLHASTNSHQIIQLVQQLFVMAASAERTGFGTGVLEMLSTCGRRAPPAQHMSMQYGTALQQSGSQQEIVVQAAFVAAQRYALDNPKLLLMQPAELQSRIAAMQAMSGLSAPQVAAMVVSQPGLLLIGEAGSTASHKWKG